MKAAGSRAVLHGFSTRRLTLLFFASVAQRGPEQTSLPTVVQDKCNVCRSRFWIHSLRFRTWCSKKVIVILELAVLIAPVVPSCAYDMIPASHSGLEDSLDKVRSSKTNYRLPFRFVFPIWVPVFIR